MKKDYLILMRKAEFTDLFRFGYGFIDRDRAVDFDGDVESLKCNIEVKNRLFAHPYPFDYSFVYIIVHFKNELDEAGSLRIEDVQGIYALDSDARIEIETSYDPRIKINDAIWPDMSFELQKQFLIEDCKKGPHNLWRILEIKTPIDEVSNLLTEDELAEIVTELLTDRRPNGVNLSFWVYLMRYERHGYFPKEAIGYVYDLVNIYINSHQGAEMPAENVERTEVYGVLEEQHSLTRISQILTDLKKEARAKNFINALDALDTRVESVFEISLLFLWLRNYFLDDFKFNKDINKLIGEALKKYPVQTAYALYLLGLYLGNTHTYRCLYDRISLAVFKKQNNIVDRVADFFPPEENNSLFPEETSQTRTLENVKFPCTVYNDKNKPGLKKNRKAKSEEEFNALINEGYVYRRPKR